MAPMQETIRITPRERWLTQRQVIERTNVDAPDKSRYRPEDSWISAAKRGPDFTFGTFVAGVNVIVSLTGRQIVSHMDRSVEICMVSE